MKRYIILAVLIALLLPMIVLPLLSAPSGVVMRATSASPYEQGSICIPNADVDATLSLVHYDCDCCYMGLWNGGRINVDADLFRSVKVDDWASIVTAEYRIIAECVSITYQVEGFIEPGGDVLVCVKTMIPMVMKVYKFVIL